MNDNIKNNFLNDLPQWSIKILTFQEEDELQLFLDVFENFFKKIEGEKPSAKALLEACPALKTLEDKIVLGIYKKESLVGLVDLIRNYPQNQVWTLGYFLIHPQARSQGMGSKFLEDLIHALRKNKVFTLRCGVQRENPRALHFWEKNGFLKIGEVQEKLGALTHQTFILEKQLKNTPK